MIDLTRELTKEREFSDFLQTVKTQCAEGYAGTRRPVVVTGLCEGAEFSFVNNLFPHLEEFGYDCMLLLVSDEKKANRLAGWLESYGNITEEEYADRFNIGINELIYHITYESDSKGEGSMFIRLKKDGANYYIKETFTG